MGEFVYPVLEDTILHEDEAYELWQTRLLPEALSSYDDFLRDAREEYQEDVDYYVKWREMIGQDPSIEGEPFETENVEEIAKENLKTYFEDEVVFEYADAWKEGALIWLEDFFDKIEDEWIEDAYAELSMERSSKDAQDFEEKKEFVKEYIEEYVTKYIGEVADNTEEDGLAKRLLSWFEEAREEKEPSTQMELQFDRSGRAVKGFSNTAILRIASKGR